MPPDGPFYRMILPISIILPPLLLLEYIKQLLLLPKLNRLSEDLSNSLAAKYIFGSKIKVLGRWIEKDGENETNGNETNLQCQTFFKSRISLFQAVIKNVYE